MRTLARGHFQLYALGLALTAGVLLVHALGWLVPLDRYLYDTRARVFQFFIAPPTDRLLHLDIDDRSISVIGRWPWKRSVVAGILDELKLAGAGPCAIDLIFGEPDAPEIVEDEFEPGIFHRIDHDQILANSIARYGEVILPLSIRAESERPATSSLHALLAGEFEKNPDAEDRAVVDALVAHGASRALASAEVARMARGVLRDVLTAKVIAAIDADPGLVDRLDVDGVKHAATGSSQVGRSTDVTRTLDEVVARVMFERQVRARLPHVPADTGGMFRSDAIDATVPAIARGAVGFGSVTFFKGLDGSLRCVPLVVRTGDRVVPHLALALACRTLGIDVFRLDIRRDRIQLPFADGTSINLPMQRFESEQAGEVDFCFDVPVWGTRDWRAMYEPGYKLGEQTVRGHLPATKAWEAYDAGQAIERNGRRAIVAMRHVLESQDGRLAEALEKHPPDPRDARAVLDWIDRTLNAVMPGTSADVDAVILGHATDDGTDAVFTKIVSAVRILRNQKIEIAKLDATRARLRADLRGRVAGKSILLGWTATGSLDSYPTAIHPQAPGVVVVGTVFNGIMTGEVWRAAPWWASPLVAALCGVMMTITITRLSAGAGAGVALLLGGVFFGVNGLVVFDWGNVLLDGAAPLVTIAGVWATGTGVRLAIEAKQRRRITRLFSSYVDPQLVDYFVARPDQVRLKGEVREMTVVFTDLAGFTTQMATLGAATVPLLNEYMSRMVPVVRRRGGYLNKFLGDGILFFFGAPRLNPNHARDAVQTVLDLIYQTELLNRDLVARGLPALHMRAGVSTGTMVVGDAGSADACDYTVLGDAVNLGARLESANKQLGTRTLVPRATVDAVGDAFLFRPVGRLKILGFDTPVECFEVMAKIEDATETQHVIARQSRNLLEAFATGSAEAIAGACDALEATGDPSSVARVYRHATVAGDGVLVLGSK